MSTEMIVKGLTQNDRVDEKDPMSYSYREEIRKLTARLYDLEQAWLDFKEKDK